MIESELEEIRFCVHCRLLNPRFSLSSLKMATLSLYAIERILLGNSQKIKPFGQRNRQSWLKSLGSGLKTGYIP